MLAFARNGLNGVHALPSMMQILVQNLVDDGIIVDVTRQLGIGSVAVNGVLDSPTMWALTQHGREFVAKWSDGEHLDPS